MKAKLYKLALWYIGKCNAEWEKRKFTNELKSLDRLTYWNFGKYMLTYGADAEWQKFSRYEVLDNAIQKLADYENAPTAYNVDAVVEQLEKEFNKWKMGVWSNNHSTPFVDGATRTIHEARDKAIDIVRNAGKDGAE